MDLNDISATQEEVLRAVVSRGEEVDWQGLPGMRVSTSNTGFAVHWKTAETLQRLGLVEVRVVQFTQTEERILPTEQAVKLLEKGTTE